KQPSIISRKRIVLKSLAQGEKFYNVTASVVEKKDDPDIVRNPLYNEPGLLNIKTLKPDEKIKSQISFQPSKSKKNSPVEVTPISLGDRETMVSEFIKNGIVVARSEDYDINYIYKEMCNIW